VGACAVTHSNCNIPITLATVSLAELLTFNGARLGSGFRTHYSLLTLNLLWCVMANVYSSGNAAGVGMRCMICTKVMEDNDNPEELSYQGWQSLKQLYNIKTDRMDRMPAHVSQLMWVLPKLNPKVVLSFHCRYCLSNMSRRMKRQLNKPSGEVC